MASALPQTVAEQERSIYENFATPLAGTFLNLPVESALIKCPACGVRQQSVLQNDLKWWASELNRIVGCLFV
ncbi:CG34445 [Drosophila busckii]|uniref:CG34445 n=2 Tax=Drosophila busckii TaxID=30019 RepID=A0A0M3QVJ4_DROBS|nr:CG34445 [Drosophila busckii]